MNQIFSTNNLWDGELVYNSMGTISDKIQLIVHIGTIQFHDNDN